MDAKLAQSLIKRIVESSTKEEILEIIKDHRDTLTDSVLQEIFIKLSNVDENGFGREISMEELKQVSPKFKTTNGLSWGRSDGKLGKQFIIQRNKTGRSISSVQLIGFNESPIQRGIPDNVKKHFENASCVMTGTSSQVEIDHKDGRYLRQYNEVDDYQPLHRGVNLIKREHCKKCKDTNQRFDAKTLGFQVSFTQGSGEWEEENKCNGCFWHDIKKFRSMM